MSSARDDRDWLEKDSDREEHTFEWTNGSFQVLIYPHKECEFRARAVALPEEEDTFILLMDRNLTEREYKLFEKIKKHCSDWKRGKCDFITAKDCEKYDNEAKD